jgi:peptide/nickel transport system permease protein
MSSPPLGTSPGEAIHDAELSTDMETAAGQQSVAGKSPRQLAVARFRHDIPSMFALAVVVLFFAFAIAAPLLTKLGVLDPLTPHQRLINADLGGLPYGRLGGVSSSHWLGVEPGTGRDVLSRLFLGLTDSLLIALSASLITVFIGTVLGIVSGAAGGWVDTVIGRFIDMVLSFPQTLMLLALSGTLVATLIKIGVPKGNFALATYVVLVLGIFGWPVFARLVRGQVLSLREREFIDSAKVIGASKFRIYFKEMLPNLWAPILVYFTLAMPAYVSAEAALSYLGVGVKPPTPTLGNILTDSTNYPQADFFYFFMPALIIAIIVVSFNLLGDGLRDALDPRSER